MDKPNITEGEWQVCHSTHTFIEAMDEGLMVCELDYEGNDPEECEANAKAISAVPEMIDTLCMIWEELESKEDWGEDLSVSQIHQLHQTLIKAGVQV